MKKLRAAVVGVGYLGTFHAQKYKALAGDTELAVELVGVCDSNPEQAKKVAGDLQVIAFAAPQDLIGKVDLVSIPAATKAHYDLAKLFLTNGIHVNVEKPITAEARQAEELMSLAKKNKLILTVGHIERFNPAYQELKKHIQNPLVIEMSRLASFKPRGADVSVLHDLMIHDIDLMFDLVGSYKIKNITAQGTSIITDTLDAASATFQFENKTTVHIQSSRLGAELKRDIRVVQKNAVLTCNLSTGLIEKITAQGAAQNIETIQAPKADGLLVETQKFIQAVRGGEVAITAEQAYQALVTVETTIQKIHGS